MNIVSKKNWRMKLGMSQSGKIPRITSQKVQTHLLREFPLLCSWSVLIPLPLRGLWKSSSLSWLSNRLNGFCSFTPLLLTVGGELSELWSLRGVDSSSHESLLSAVFFVLLGDTGEEGPGEGPGEGTGEGTGDAQMREYRGEHVEKLLNSLEKLLNSSSSSSSSSVSSSWL